MAAHSNIERAVSVANPDQDAVELETILKTLDTDPYNEDEAELRFLYSKPSCFIILGKPGCGKTKLAQRFAQEWKCVHINATDVIQQNIDLQTESGMKCNDILFRGEAIPEQVVAQMIEEKVNSPEVAHHGYILDGFPSLSEEYLSIKDQLELVKNWKLKPDFIFNIKIHDKDLLERRFAMRVDSVAGGVYTKQEYEPEKTEKKEVEEGEEEEEFEEEEENFEDENEAEEEEEKAPVLSTEVLERLVTRPEDMPKLARQSLQIYSSIALRIYEDYMADHDQQYLIEMDGNQTVAVLFKQLMSRLSCFVLRPAAVPRRLIGDEDDEIQEEMDIEDLMRLLCAKGKVAPRYRLRRSRWMRYCPVTLYEGSLVNGRAEFAVGFLDKIYFIATNQALGKFIQNPRPYLMPPQPRPPCKLVVLGPELSGKTTLCYLLAEKYGAKVLDIDELFKPSLAEESEKRLDSIRSEALENALKAVKTKIREQREMDAAAKEIVSEQDELTEITEEAEEEQSEDQPQIKEAEEEQPEAEPPHDKEAEEKQPEDEPQQDKEIEEEKPKDEPQKDKETEVEKPEDEPQQDKETEVEKPEDEPQKDKETEDEVLTESTSNQVAESAATSDKDDKTDEESQQSQDVKPLLSLMQVDTADIDASHPEVVAMVDAAMAEAQKQEVTLSPEQMLDIMESAIENTEKEMAQSRPDAPLRGGWILDNFPRTRDQWTACIEKGLVPDDMVMLRDNGDFLQKRWLNNNKALIEESAKLREEEARKEKQRKDEELRRKRELRMEKDAERKAKEEERLAAAQAREEAGEPPEEGGEVVQDEEKDNSIEETKDDDEAEEALTVTSDLSDEAIKSDSPVKKTAADGPELAIYKQRRKDYDKEAAVVQATITGSTALEPIVLDVVDKTEDKMIDDVVIQMERPLKYHGWEYGGGDVDEEDEDREQEVEEDVEEEDMDPNRSRKKLLGDTSYFCPVALHEHNVLIPGNPEVAVKYASKVYYLANADDRDQFLTSPDAFLPNKEPPKPPAIRLIILGPRGSGKTLHGRHLARKLGIFHISFRDRLQELIISKTKHRIGPEYEEDQDDEEEEIPEDEDDAEDDENAEAKTDAVTGPDGKPYTEEVKPPKSQSSDAVPVTAEEQNEDLSLTEDEEIIKSNLEGDDPLGNTILKKIVGGWWTKEPFKSTGFVLEGFPRTIEETRFMAENNLFPDVVLILAVEDTDVISRLLPPKFKKWSVKRDKQLAKRALKKDKAKKKRDAAMQKRREELRKDMIERRASKKANKDDSSHESEASDAEDEEDEELDEETANAEIETMLAEEFEEEDDEEEEDMESEEDAKDRLKNDLAEMYDNDTNKLAAIQETLEELLIPRIELEGGRKPHIVRYMMSNRLRPIVDCRASLFERVYPINEKLAKKMLQTGHKQPSKFGRWCPVKLSEGDCIQPMSGPGYSSYPCVYRSHIYFMPSMENQAAFMENPRKYLQQPKPMPVVPIRIAIIGPTKSGKTSLALRFAEEYGLLRLSIGEAIRMVILMQPNSTLTEEMNSYLKRGKPLPDDLAVQALEVCMMDMRCHTRGFVLDGYPMTIRQVQLMTERAIIPVRVIELYVDNKEVMKRGTHDRISPTRIFPIHDSPQILAIRLNAYKMEIPMVRDWYTEQHQNLSQVSGERSKWWMWHEVLNIAKDSVVCIQNYLEKVSDGKAASIADMCVTPKEFCVRLGDFKQYCPVCLGDRGELVDSSTESSLNYAAEFRGHYYKMSGEEELKSFLREPEKYVPPHAPHSLPPVEMLPHRLTVSELSEDALIELQGYCPVRFLDGKCRYEAIVLGDPKLIVQYRDKYYNFESEERLLKFMRLPDKYWNLRLPEKLPPAKSSMSVAGLPMLGFLEQTIAVPITKAMTATGQFKPKYPFLTSSRSALLYVAFHLKAYNPKSSDYIRKKYKQKLKQFEETCQLIPYLGNTMTVRFIDEHERPKDFDEKFKTFFALRDIEPTTTWIA